MRRTFSDQIYKSTNLLCRNHPALSFLIKKRLSADAHYSTAFVELTKTAVGGVLKKKLLLKISQYSQENTSVKFSFP